MRSVKELAVKVTADVTDFARGTQDAARDSDELAREAEQATEKIARSFKDMTDAAERATDSMARNSKQAFSKVSGDAAHEMSSGPAKDSFKDAGSEVGAEFASNLGESLASGDLTSVAKDTAGGLVSAFASIPGGIGVALAGAAAIATSIFATMQAEAEKRSQRIADQTAAIFERMTGDMQKALGELSKGAEWDAFVAGFSSTGDVAEGLRNMVTLTEKTGGNIGDMSAAFFAGGPAWEAQKKRMSDIAANAAHGVANVRGQKAALDPAAKAAQTLRDRMREVDVAAADAEVSTRATLDSLIGSYKAASQLERNLEAAGRAADRLNNKTGPAGTVVGGRARL